MLEVLNDSDMQVHNAGVALLVNICADEESSEKACGCGLALKIFKYCLAENMPHKLHFMLLANLTRYSCGQSALADIYSSPEGKTWFVDLVRSLVATWSRNRCEETEEDYALEVLRNLTSHHWCRSLLLGDYKPGAKILCYLFPSISPLPIRIPLSSTAHIRRSSAIATIRNCLLDVDAHDFLDEDERSTLCQTLGAALLDPRLNWKDDEERARVDAWWLLRESVYPAAENSSSSSSSPSSSLVLRKEGPPDDTLRFQAYHPNNSVDILHAVEILAALCSTFTGRKSVKDSEVYQVLRELHLNYQEDETLTETIERVVQFLIMDEEEPTGVGV